MIGNTVIGNTAVTMTGFVSEVKVLNVNLPKDACFIQAFRFEHKYAVENPNLRHYFKLDEPVSSSAQLSYAVEDSGFNAETFVFITASASDFPKTSLLTAAEFLPQLCLTNEIKDCQGFYDWSILRLVPDPLYLGFSRNGVAYFNIFNFRNGLMKHALSLAWIWEAGDKVGLFSGTCRGEDMGTKVFEQGATEPGFTSLDKNWGSLPEEGFYELCGYKSRLQVWVALDHIRVTQSSYFAPFNTAVYFTPGNRLTVALRTSKYSNIGDTLVLARDCLSILDPSTHSGHITGTKISAESFIVDHVFDIGERFSLKSNGKCSFCIIPFYSKNPQKPMAGYLKSTYIVIQNLDLYPEIALLPKPTQGSLYSRSSISSIDLGNNFRKLYNYDTFFFIDCSTKADDNVIDFECEGSDKGSVNYISSDM